MQFFGKVRIIDGLQTEERDDTTVVRLATQGLGQLRHDFRGAALDGSLVVRWFKDGTEIPELQDRFEWQLPTRDARGEWEARVRFETPEVRHDPRGLLTDRESVRI